MSEGVEGRAHSLQDEDAALQPRGVDLLARAVLNIFYRDVEIVGTERVPAEGGVVFVGNHVSGLLDPAIFLAYLPRASRFLGKSTLWDVAVLRPFLKLAAAIPVYRRQDPGVDGSKNSETFDRCHRVLAAGGTIALFPEGRSHNESALVPLKTGVARIVLETIKRFEHATVSIVPVGLTFDDKTRFRSRLLVQVGTPIRPKLTAGVTDEQSRRAVRDLTEQIRQSLEVVTLNYPSWEEARLIERAAAIFSRPSLKGPAEQPLADRFEVHQLFIDGYEHLLNAHPEQVHRVSEEVRAYDRGLEALRLRDEQVGAEYAMETAWRFTTKSVVLIFVRLPLGLLGTVLNFPAYQGTAMAARRLTDSPDVAATYKIFPSLLFYPMTWMLWAAAAVVAYRTALGPSGWTLALSVFVGALLAGPISGYFAIRFHQRKDLFIEQARAFFLMRSGRRGVQALKEQRRRLVAQVGELASTLTGSQRSQ